MKPNHICTKTKNKTKTQKHNSRKCSSKTVKKNKLKKILFYFDFTLQINHIQTKMEKDKGGTYMKWSGLLCLHIYSCGIFSGSVYCLIVDL